MLANAIKEGAAQTGENIASSAGAYGQHTAIMDQYDVIVLAPQVRSYYNDMRPTPIAWALSCSPRAVRNISTLLATPLAPSSGSARTSTSSSLCWCPDPQFGHLSLFVSHRRMTP